MKQNVGLSALIIAAFAFVMRTGPGPQPSQSPRAQATQSEANPNMTSQAEILEGPWLATRTFFQAAADLDQQVLTGATSFKTPSSIRECIAPSSRNHSLCRTQWADYFGIPDPNYPIQFLIATVPDPLHSRLSLSTDSAIQAIAEAADASGWIFATQWLPWVDSANSEEKDPGKRRLERQETRIQEKQPGILVFRRSASYVDQNATKEKPSFKKDVLLIFLVGETPTAGVNPAQFQLARAYMRAIRETTDRVRILGPTFSGSFYSLERLLTDDRSQGAVNMYHVRSGTVTGSQDGAILQGSGIDFKGATAHTGDQSRYLRTALRQLGIDDEHAVSLIEDESAFGSSATEVSVAPENPPPVSLKQHEEQNSIRVLRFPRDISHLRNAYRDAMAASKSGNSTSPDIEFSIKDPENGEDSIPIFSGSQSPLSQYGIVNKITGAIQRDGIRLVQVKATNVLDMLFLANILKRQCPDTRLLLNYPDVLLVQAAQNEPLTGTLVLASYPAFFASNAWMGGGQKQKPVTFPDANSESIYDATVLLLNNDAAASQLLADYHWRGLDHAPTWLLTLDRQGFLPVDVFPHKATEENGDTWFQRVTPLADGALLLPYPPINWSFVSTAVALPCLALSLWIWWISSHPTCEMDARFSILQIDSESVWRWFHIFIFLLVLLLMEMTIWLPGLLFKQPTRFILLLGGSGIAVIFAAWSLLKNLKVSRSAIRSAWLWLVGAATFLALWIVSCSFPRDRGLFFAFRARELRFGSSPTWPVLASLGAIALFTFIHLTRYYLAACQKPDVITSGLSTALEERMREAWQDFNSALEGDRGLWFASRTQRPTGLILFALAAGLVGLLFRIDLLMRSIDGLTYNAIALVLQLLVITLLLMTCVQIRSLWRSLQTFVVSLGMLPVARAFKSVDRSGTDRPIWVRRLNLQSIDTHVQSIYVLHNMTIVAKNVLAVEPADSKYLAGIKMMSDEYGGRIRKLLNVNGKRSRGETLTLTKAMRRSNKEIAKETIGFLHNYWSRSPLEGPEIEDKAGANGNSAAKITSSELSPLDQLAGLAERFVALHYSSFILYGVRQIQNLLLFISSGFVLLMISLNCYSIQAPQFMGKLLLMLFLIIGASTLSCLVGLEKNLVLSRMAGSDPGKLNTGFYLKIAAYGALPALSLLASEFPSISNFLLSWVEPSLEAFK
jgi:hypothetical protein